MTRPALISGLIATTLALQAASIPAFADEPEFFRDIRPTHWVWNGADPLTTQTILDRVAEAGAGAAHPDLAGAGGGTVNGMRIHRSHWVALEHVTSVEKDDSSLSVLLTSGETLPVSRANRQAVRDAFQADALMRGLC